MRKIEHAYAIVPVSGGYAVEYRTRNRKPEYMGEDGLWVRSPSQVTTPFKDQATAEYHVGALKEGDL